MKIERIHICCISIILLFISGCAGTQPIKESGFKIDFKNSIGMEFAKIPSGQFSMGLSKNDNYSELIYEMGKNPKHLVEISNDFYLQTTEVTQDQWKMIMGNNPSYFKKCGGNCPVDNVSWDDAQEFINRLNATENTNKYRLPTEAEWELASRAGTVTNLNFAIVYRQAKLTS